MLPSIDELYEKKRILEELIKRIDNLLLDPKSDKKKWLANRNNAKYKLIYLWSELTMHDDF